LAALYPAVKVCQGVHRGAVIRDGHAMVVLAGRERVGPGDLDPAAQEIGTVGRPAWR